MSLDSHDEQRPDSSAVFATTHWSVVLAAHGAATPAATAALETIFRAYQKPLYSYVRRRGQSHHDAEDLIQAFFRRLLAKDVLRAASQQRGRFRAFLLASLKNFLANEHDHDAALKRGGGRPLVSLDAAASGSPAPPQPISPEPPPERLFDREWAQTIFDQALQRLEQEFTDEGKQAQFSALARFLTEPPAPGDYERVAVQIGLRPSLMATVVSRLRQRLRDLVRAEIAATVATPAEVDEELRYLVELMTG
jgi:RNA polymerase sigma-70 factor (ECF subfamily)